MIYRFDSCCLDVDRRELFRNGVCVSVEPQVFDLIHFLIRNRDRVVSRDDLVRHVWNGRVVSDSAVTSRIAIARQALGDCGDEQRLIRTFARKGIRFVGLLSETAAADADRHTGTVRQFAASEAQAERATDVYAADDRPSIAVLPFTNLSKDQGQDYFVEGMLDEIVTALTQIRSLFVISSESSLALKESPFHGPVAAAVQLRVRYLLEGSVRRCDGRVRIAVRLIDAGRGEHIWAGRFDEPMQGIFELQDRIALQVAAIIEPRILEAEIQRVVRRPVDNLGCYDLYLRAAPLRASCRKAEVTRALQLLERALILDPGFAPALAQAAGCHSQIYMNCWADDRQWHREKGLMLAERAIQAGSEDAAVLAQAANALMDLDRDVNRAIAVADRAIAMNPSCARARFISGLLCLATGDGSRAVEHLETAGRLDPISPLKDVIRAHMGVGWAIQGDLRRGLDLIRATTYRTARIHLVLAAIYGHLELATESRDELALFRACTAAAPDEMITAAAQQPSVAAWLREGLASGRRVPVGAAP